jgi:hypothetical protein
MSEQLCSLFESCSMMTFLSTNATYVVLICALTVWAGIAAYLWRIEQRLTQLEQSPSEHTP